MNHPNDATSIGGYIAAMKEVERKEAGRPYQPKFWQVENAPVWVEIRKIRYAATVLEWGFASSGDYDWCKLQLEQEIFFLDGSKQKRTWIHPKPIQSYKLRKRVV